MDAVMKRVTDIVLTSSALLLVPLMVLIALAVKLTSAGPGLFRQRRYGLNGEEMRCCRACFPRPRATTAARG